MVCTLGHYGPEDFLADRVKHLALIVPTQKLMDGGEGADDGLLQDPEGNCHILQILGSC